MKGKSTLFIIAVLLLITQPNCSKPYAIRFEKKIHDFGTVIEGEEVNYTYIFENTGTEALNILSVRAACACTVVLDWDKTVTPGKKGKIPVAFKTPSLNGAITKVIFVTTNVPGQQPIQLSLTGRVLIPVEIVPQNTWLGDVTRATKSLSGSFEIRNNQESPLQINAVIQPDDVQATYQLKVSVPDREYKLDYTIYPPFPGKGTTGRQFTLEIDKAKEKFLYLKFFYYVKE